MSCYLASLGAQVVGVDTDPEVIAIAKQEAARCGLTQSVSLQVNSGDLAELEKDKYDFVFTKSVLVLIADQTRALEDIGRLLKADGEYMAVENLAVGRFLTFLRHNVWHRKWKDRSPFQGIDEASFDCFSSLFKHLRYRKHHGLVVAINASHPRIR